MTIIQFDKNSRTLLGDMLVAYFNELSGDIPKHFVRGKLLDLFEDMCSRQIIHISIAFLDDLPIGFSIYQIDSELSDWCKRPNWGCIREFYISPTYRRKGYGSMLAIHAEGHLYALGAEHIYLTADDAVSFWEHCGYRNTHELCTNDLEIMTK